MSTRPPIEPKRPWYEIPLVVVSGLLIGYSLPGGPWWPITLAVGVIGALWWWFGIASDEACARRYEKERIRVVTAWQRDTPEGRSTPGASSPRKAEPW